MGLCRYQGLCVSGWTTSASGSSRESSLHTSTRPWMPRLQTSGLPVLSSIMLHAVNHGVAAPQCLLFEVNERDKQH